MGELSAIIGTLSAMDWNDCPQSIGIPVRNRRNPQGSRETMLKEEEARLKERLLELEKSAVTPKE